MILSNGGYWTPQDVRLFVVSAFYQCGECYAKTARLIGVSPALIWKMVNEKQDDSNKIRRLWKLNNQKRHRRAADLHTAERAAQFDAMISERDTSLTEWMNKELDRWLTR